MAKILEDEPIFGEDYRYLPVVGDSVTYDMPILVKYKKNNHIDIKPICDVFDKSSAIEFENEQWRDFSEKDFTVLSKNGWCDVGYVYKHKTNKKLKRVVTNRGLVDCTEDHSLFSPDMREIKPSELSIGDSIAVYDGNIEYTVSNSDIESDLAWYCGVNACNGKFVIPKNLEKRFGKLDFYTSYGEKKIPSLILNSNKDIKKSFINGFCHSLFSKKEINSIEECTEITQTNKVVMAGISFILKELGIPFEMKLNDENHNLITFAIKTKEEKETYGNGEVLNVIGTASENDYVYDISCDGTFVNSLGMIVLHNTDGVNFLCANKLRYTEEHPYYCTGKGRNGKVGKAYVGVWADVQEFEDTYLVPEIPGGLNKMGLDIDDTIPANLLMRRKIYSDLLDNGELKRVGNAIKSRTMPGYISNMIRHGLKLLLYGHGKEFIEYYYDYIEKIDSFKIPLKDIASVGKIKISLDEYKEKCKEVTAAGSKKARQAWYELAIKEGLKVNMGDTIYYINTGKKKSDADVQRVTKYYIKTSDLFSDNNETDVTKEYSRELNKIRKVFKENPKNEDIKKYIKENGKLVNLSEYVKMQHPNAEERDELIFNCILVPNNLIEDDEDHFCDENIEYNVEKYIDMLNKRILNLTVCFDRSIRERVDENGKVVSNILITNPSQRKEFTEEECKLIYGQPLNESDQDKLEDVMMPEDKEIRFWLSIDEKPPYIDECGLDWEEIKADYLKRQEVLKQDGIKDEVNRYIDFIENKLSIDMYDKFIEDGEIPSELLSFLYIDTKGMDLVSKKYNVTIGSITDIIDKSFQDAGFENE